MLLKRNECKVNSCAGVADVLGLAHTSIVADMVERRLDRRLSFSPRDDGVTPSCGPS